MNEIFHEDCLDTLTKRDIKYDYTCFSPPDYDELNLTPIKDDKEYLDWQKKVYSKLNPSNNVVTIVTSLRRFKARTIIASYNIGRNYYGSEKDEEIFNIAHKRTENLKNIANNACH